jgi:hypothetical protein
LDDIKKQARDLISLMQVNYDNEIQGKKVTPPVMNRVFAGNPGLFTTDHLFPTHHLRHWQNNGRKGIR